METIFYKNNTAAQVEKIFFFLLCASPLFVLTIGGWMSGMLFITSALSIYLLFNIKSETTPDNQKAKLNKWLIAMVAALSSHVIATFLGHLFRQSWNWPDYDTPFRFVLAIPILLIIFKRQLPVINYWLWVIPLTIIVTYILMPFLPKTGWGNEPGRLTTSMVDPLTFGRICLTFSLLSIVLVPIKKKKTLPLLIIQIVGALIGIYLSIRSGSRTGWLAFPIVLMIIFITYGPKNKFIALAIAILLSVGGSYLTYEFSNTVKQRIDFALSEIQSYKFNQVNPDTSAGMRISFARMGLYYVGLSPFSGNTKEDLINHKDDQEISRYASAYTRDTAIQHQFHNEFTTNTVKNGIWGFISTTLIFFVPFSIFLAGLFKPKCRKLALAGVTYLICELVSAMSTEVIGLKFTASLYSILIAGFSGTVLHMMTTNSPDNHNLKS